MLKTLWSLWRPTPIIPVPTLALGRTGRKVLRQSTPAVVRTVGQHGSGRALVVKEFLRHAVVMNWSVVFIDGCSSYNSWRLVKLAAVSVGRGHQLLTQYGFLEAQSDPHLCLEEGALLYLPLERDTPQQVAAQLQRTLQALRNTFASRRRQALAGPLRPLMVILDECCMQGGQMVPEVVALAADAACVGVTMIISDLSSVCDLPELDGLVDCHIYQWLADPQGLSEPCRQRLSQRLHNLDELRQFGQGEGVICLRGESPDQFRRRPAKATLFFPVGLIDPSLA